MNSKQKLKYVVGITPKKIFILLHQTKKKLIKHLKITNYKNQTIYII